ncbi:MAG: PAS domain-containing protein [Balneolaceae bacterium]|nr:PAS domain-containing protein [Balneolaceae bacterium]
MGRSSNDKYNAVYDIIDDFDSLVLELMEVLETNSPESIKIVLEFLLQKFLFSVGIITLVPHRSQKSQEIINNISPNLDSDFLIIDDYIRQSKVSSGILELSKISQDLNLTSIPGVELKDQLDFACHEIQLQPDVFASITLFSESSVPPNVRQQLERFLGFAARIVKTIYGAQQKLYDLNQELDFHKKLISNSMELICMHQPTGEYTYVSESVKLLLGYEPNELIGLSPYDLFHVDDLERIMKESHEPAIQGESYSNMEYRIRRKDGQFVWFNTTTQPILNEQGDVVALQTTSRNIDAKKRQEVLFVETQRMTKTGGWELDLQTMEFYGTDYAYEIHDLDPSEIVTLELELSHYPDDGTRQLVLDVITKCAKHNEPFDIKIPFITASNQHKYIRAKGKSITHNGIAYKLVGTFQDITEQVKLDTMFKASQQLANIGGWEYDIWSGDLFITEGVCEICEIPYNSVLHFEELLLFFPNDGPRKQVKDIVTKAMQTAEKQEFELPAISSSGKHKYVHAILKPVHIGKKLVKIVGTLQDVTEKTKIEYFLRDTQDVAKVGGWDYYVTSGDLYWSEEMYSIHELKVGTKVTPDHMTKYLTGESVDRIQQALKESLITGKPYELETQIITAKGSIKFVRIIGNPMSSNGEVFRIYGTYQDITESNHFIQKISDQNILLAKEKETRDKLYSILAHDLRNSMSGVNSLLSIVIDEIESKNFDEQEAIEHLRLVLNSSVNGIKLLENIQGWIELQSGELSPIPEYFNIENRMKGCLELLNPMIKAKNITINTKVDSPSVAFADPQMITTICRNLVNNAIKYSHEGSDIDIRVENDSKSEQLSISIKDYGIGMPESIKKNLFNRNNRPQRDGTSQEAGTGLGLLLTKELATMNNGQIEVESEEDSGSVFTLILPTKHP